MTRVLLLVSALVALDLALSSPSEAQTRPNCNWCGCQGGPGYRGPNGQCVAYPDLTVVCGNPPDSRCRYEGNQSGPGRWPPNPRQSGR